MESENNFQNQSGTPNPPEPKPAGRKILIVIICITAVIAIIMLAIAIFFTYKNRPGLIPVSVPSQTETASVPLAGIGSFILNKLGSNSVKTTFKANQELLNSTKEFGKYLTETAPTISNAGRPNYIISGSLGPSLLSQAEGKVAILDLAALAKGEIKVVREIELSDSARETLRSFARTVGDFDYVLLNKNMRIGVGGKDVLVLDNMPEGVRSIFNTYKGQYRVHPDAVTPYGDINAARIRIDGKEYLVAGPMDSASYKIFDMFSSYSLRNKDPGVLNSDFAKIFSAAKEMGYTEKQILQNTSNLIKNYLKIWGDTGRNVFNKNIEKILTDKNATPEIKRLTEQLKKDINPGASGESSRAAPAAAVPGGKDYKPGTPGTTARSVTGPPNGEPPSEGWIFKTAPTDPTAYTEFAKRYGGDAAPPPGFIYADPKALADLSKDAFEMTLAPLLGLPGLAAFVARDLLHSKTPPQAADPSGSTPEAIVPKTEQISPETVAQGQATTGGAGDKKTGSVAETVSPGAAPAPAPAPAVPAPKVETPPPTDAPATPPQGEKAPYSFKPLTEEEKANSIPVKSDPAPQTPEPEKVDAEMTLTKEEDPNLSGSCDGSTNSAPASTEEGLPSGLTAGGYADLSYQTFLDNAQTFGGKVYDAIYGAYESLATAVRDTIKGVPGFIEDVQNIADGTEQGKQALEKSLVEKVEDQSKQAEAFRQQEEAKIAAEAAAKAEGENYGGVLPDFDPLAALPSRDNLEPPANPESPAQNPDNNPTKPPGSTESPKDPPPSSPTPAPQPEPVQQQQPQTGGTDFSEGKIYNPEGDYSWEGEGDREETPQEESSGDSGGE